MPCSAPEVQIGDQLIAAGGAVPAETQIGGAGIVSGGNGQVRDDGLTAIATHRSFALTGTVTQVAKGLDQGGAITQFRLDGAEVRHQETGLVRVCSNTTAADWPW